MSVNIPSAELKKLVKLAERKEALMAEIQEIDRHMLRLERGLGTSADAVRKGRLTFSVTSKSKGGLPRARSRGQRKTRVVAPRKS
ncbi:MAG: hypothetical protein QOG67_2346 [Verrucomicrobiota bacterium]|jgi:hypothetical protein